MKSVISKHINHKRFTSQINAHLSLVCFERNSPILLSRHRCMEAWCCCTCNIQYWAPNLYNSNNDMSSVHVMKYNMIRQHVSFYKLLTDDRVPICSSGIYTYSFTFWTTIRNKSGIQCLAQGHYDLQTGRVRDQTSSTTEPQLPLHC